MEKFSKYRDPATGVAPLIYPLPASIDSLSPLTKITITPLKWLLGFIRTFLIVLLLFANWILTEVLMSVLLVSPPLHQVLTRIMTSLIIRTVLFLLGLPWISVEVASLRKTGRSPPVVPFSPKAGDLIIANSSSYIDLLYLAFRYNPSFLLPVSSLGSKASSSSSSLITSYRCVSLTTALLSIGSIPERSERGQTLGEILSNPKLSKPLVWFPEGTTSNNKALLKFAELVPASSTTNKMPKKLDFKIYLLAFKYPLPTSLHPSATYTIPSSFLKFLPLIPHIFNLTSTPFPTHLKIRKLHPSESPSFPTANITTGQFFKKEDLESIAESLSNLGRFKRVKGIDWELKNEFLEMKSGRTSKRIK